MATYIGTAPPSQSVVLARFQYTATSSQTAFTGADGNGSVLRYETAPPVLVFLNGVQLIENTDFTKTSSTVLTLASGAATRDIVEIMPFGSFDIASIDPTAAINKNLGTAGQVLAVNSGATAMEFSTISHADAVVMSIALGS